MVDNRGPELSAVCLTFVSMAFVTMLLRGYVRLFMVKQFGWDDFAMLLATVRTLSMILKENHASIAFQLLTNVV